VRDRDVLSEQSRQQESDPPDRGAQVDHACHCLRANAQSLSTRACARRISSTSSCGSSGERRAQERGCRGWPSGCCRAPRRPASRATPARAWSSCASSERCRSHRL
jgi:hypothetical protein